MHLVLFDILSSLIQMVISCHSIGCMIRNRFEQDYRMDVTLKRRMYDSSFFDVRNNA